MSSVVVKWVDAAAVRRAVDDYAARLLATRKDVEEIVVFGSFADGTFAPGSDVDLLIVLTASDKAVRDRVPEFLPGAFPVAMDVFPYTREEMDRLAPSPLLDAASASTWRYGRDPELIPT